MWHYINKYNGKFDFIEVMKELENSQKQDTLTNYYSDRVDYYRWKCKLVRALKSKDYYGWYDISNKNYYNESDIYAEQNDYNYFMDTKNEDFYHGLVLGMMFYLDNHYYVKSNEESGLGRYDVVIEPKNKNNRGFILEFKVVKNEDNLEKVSEEAIEQIMEKKYDVGLKDRGVKDVTFVGVAFCGKVVKVSYR